MEFPEMQTVIVKAELEDVKPVEAEPMLGFSEIDIYEKVKAELENVDAGEADPMLTCVASPMLPVNADGPFAFACVKQDTTVLPCYSTLNNECTNGEPQPGRDESNTDVFRNKYSQNTSKRGSSKKCPECLTGINALSHDTYCRNYKTGKYQCKMCDRKFVSARRLREHMISHTGEKPYKCSECSFACGTWSGLKLHKETKHMVEPCICEMCGQVFLHHIRLKRHVLNRHDNVGFFKCQNCNEVFSIISKYKYHRRYAHRSAEIVYECDDCGKTFTKKCNLTVHVRGVHLHAAKRETCSICHISTTNIKKHMVTHTRERKFPCSLCEKKFMYSYDLAKHMKSSIHRYDYF